MSLIRFLFLSYLLNNFDKVMGRIVFLLVYSYLLSLVILTLNEGVVLAFANKNPISSYAYLYRVFDWYYNHRSALTYSRVLYIIIICVTTYWIQSIIWSMDWKNLPRKIVLFLIRLIVNVKNISSGRTKSSVESETYGIGSKNIENGIVLAKSRTLEKVEAILEKVIIAIFSERSSGIARSRDQIMRLKDEVGNDITSALNKFIDVLVKTHRRMDNQKQSKKEDISDCY